MKSALHSALGALIAFLWITSLCQGAPIRELADRWRKFPGGGFFSPSRSSFTWEAFIHGPSGVASSNERSGPFSLTKDKPSPWSVLKKKISHRAHHSSSSHPEQGQGEDELKQQMIKEEEELIVETSRQFVGAWSDFLCQGTISLGILRCEKGYETKKKAKRTTGWRKVLNPTASLVAPQNSTSSSSLMARFTTFPVKLLEFGIPVESSSPSFVYENEAEGNNKNNSVVLGSWDIPLAGGGLVLEEDESQKEKSRMYSKNDPECRGKLMFAIVKKTGLTNEKKEYELVTGIRNYRPWLAGGGYNEDIGTHENIWDALKANREATTGRLCHGFYLSTQSMVHAYVTWRFHHAWKKELATTFQAAKRTIREKEHR